MLFVPPDEATKLILKGTAPAGMRTGILQLSLEKTKLPITASVSNGHAQHNPEKPKKPPTLPAGLSCYSLNLAGQPLTTLPDDLQVEYKLDLTGCAQLTELPANLKVSALILTNCSRLESLPEGLQVNFLQLDGCASLRRWPESAQVIHGWARARGCAELEGLPAKLGPLASLDLRGCRRISRIAPGVQVLSWIDIGGTAVASLPENLSGIGLRWRGVPVTAQIAFFPETLTGPKILAERNVELRRVMIERAGFDRFVHEVKAQVLDTDQDRGGERKLLRVALDNDEPIVLVSVHCPSTGRRYLVRVPPKTRTCREAVAWTAGFDNPHDYAPLEET